MSCLSTYHEELQHGVGKCSVPMWCGGCPAGFCDKEAYGPQPETTYYWDNTGRRRRLDGRYDGYVPTLACPSHGGPKEPDPVLVSVERASWFGRPLGSGTCDRKQTAEGE